MWNRIKAWLESEPEFAADSPPFRTGKEIDLVAVREDGGVDLIIVARGLMDGSSATQILLEQKVMSYLAQRNTAAFTTEFRHPTAEQVRVVIETDRKLPHSLKELIKRLEPVATANRASLQVRPHHHRKFLLRDICFPVLQPGHDAGAHYADPNSRDPRPGA